MSEEKHGIQELSELLDGMAELAKVGKKISKDGIGMEDLVHLQDLVAKFDVLKNAATGLSNLDDEIKDLDSAEILALVGKIMAKIKEVEAI
jgi:hypothetical protein